MTTPDSRVTIHMAASLDGYIARRDGSVDWMETSDEFAGGEIMAPETIAAFLETIDWDVMGLPRGADPKLVVAARRSGACNETVVPYAGWRQSSGRVECLPPAYRAV